MKRENVLLKDEIHTENKFLTRTTQKAETKLFELQKKCLKLTQLIEIENQTLVFFD